MKQNPVCLGFSSIGSVDKLPASEDYTPRHTQQIHSTLSVFVVWRQPGLKSMCTHKPLPPSHTHARTHTHAHTHTHKRFKNIDWLYLNDGPWLWAPSHSMLEQNLINGWKMESSVFISSIVTSSVAHSHTNLRSVKNETEPVDILVHIFLCLHHGPSVLLWGTHYIHIPTNWFLNGASVTHKC